MEKNDITNRLRTNFGAPFVPHSAPKQKLRGLPPPEAGRLDIGHFTKGIDKSPNKANAFDRLQRWLIFTLSIINKGQK